MSNCVIMSINSEAAAGLQLVKTIDATPKFTYAKTDIQRCLPGLSLQRKTDSLRETPFNLEDPQDGLHEFGQDCEPKTILYLAYGSNLCAETFQGRRGIRPIGQANVVVPELVMTFDLAGLPYLEPCFANTRYRDPSPAANDDEKAALISKSPPGKGYRKTRWKKGLVGVVYEVTTKEYATIIATEGGGASYQDVLVDCYELPPGEDVVPAHPNSQPFKAHTLFSPSYPPNQKRPKGEHSSRPDPNYAQASQRYLKLITDGANEHSLPQEYKAYLHSLHPYIITTTNQKIGRAIFMIAFIPAIVVLVPLTRLFADKNGRAPAWLQALFGAVFRSVWICYDAVFKRAFGDGERTIGDDGGAE